GATARWRDDFRAARQLHHQRRRRTGGRCAAADGRGGELCMGHGAGPFGTRGQARRRLEGAVIRRRSVPRLRDRWRPVTRFALAWMRRAWVPAVGSVCGVGLAGLLWYGVPWTARHLAAHPYFALAP